MTSRIDRLIALRSFPPHADLSLEEVEALVPLTVERSFAAGATVMPEGEHVTEVFFVVRGRVKLTHGGKSFNEFGPHSIIGGLAAIAGDPEGYGCVALEDTTVLALPSEVLLESMEEHFDRVRPLIATLATQILKIRRRLGPAAGFERSEWQPAGAPPAPLNLIERLSLLRGAIPFGGSRLEALTDLAKDVREVRFSADQLLWQESDEADDTLFIVWGAVRAKNKEGLELRFGPGDIVGFLSAFGESGRWFEARAETELVALQLTPDMLIDIFQDHSELAVAMIRSMAGGLLALIKKELSLANDAP